MYTFTYESFLPYSKEKIMTFLLQDASIERMIPTWLNAKLIGGGSSQKSGSKTILRIGKAPFHVDWVIQYEAVSDRGEFVHKLNIGPLRYCRHTRSVESVEGGCVVKDKVEYKLPIFISKRSMQKKIYRVFSFVHQRIKNDLLVFYRYDTKPLKVLLSGSSGLVGRALSSFLQSQGHDVWSLKRGDSDVKNKIIGWNPSKDEMDPQSIDGFDAVVHLAGENIGVKAWTQDQKDNIFKSRCRDTWLLSKTMSRCKNHPKVFVCASAIGFYGDCGQEIVNEDSPPGKDFLADLCVKWEEAARVLSSKDVRCVQTRFGLILDPQGGVLSQILPVFRMCLGGRLGSGSQVYSWVALDDVIYAIYHCIKNENLSGPVNIVSTSPTCQKTFASMLAKALHKGCFMPIPSFFLKIVLGERADALILRSTNVEPLRLKQSGYEFIYEDLQKYFTDAV